jgi:hypothetical protein
MKGLNNDKKIFTHDLTNRESHTPHLIHTNHQDKKKAGNKVAIFFYIFRWFQVLVTLSSVPYFRHCIFGSVL